MKSLYTYLLNEARGLLREEYDYTSMVNFITDVIMSDYERLSKIYWEYTVIEDSDLMSVYPEWIGGAQIILNNHKGNDVGSFVPAEATMDNNKLYFDIYINIKALLDQAHLHNHQVSLQALKKLCENALQHEFKHAFDEWIRRVKNLTSSSEDIKYFTNKRLLSKTKLNPLWKDFFTSTHYLYSKYEKTAHQQEMLYFYRNTPLGKLFIKSLKIKFQNPTKLLEYVYGMHISQYTAFYYNLAEEMSEVLKGGFDVNDIIPIIQNPYIDHLWMTSQLYEDITKMSIKECDDIVNEIKNVEFQNIKMPKQGTSKDILIKFLQNVKNQNIKYLNTIYKRSF